MSALLRTSPRLLIPDRKRCRDYGVVWLSGGMRGGAAMHDAAPRKRHATFGASAAAPTWTKGRQGEPSLALAAAGSQYAEYAGAVASGYPISIWCWCRFTDTTNSFRDPFFLGSTSADHYCGLQIMQSGAGLTIHAPLYNCTRNAAVAVPSSTVAINDGNWHLLVGTSIIDRHRLYVDGALIATDTTSVTFPLLDRTTIGALNYGGTRLQFFNGDVAGCGVAAAELTAKQISNLCRNPFYLYRNPPSQFRIPWAGNATTVPGAPTPRLGRRPTRFFRSSF